MPRRSRLASCLSLTALLAGCTHPTPELEPGPELRGWPDWIEWPAAGEEAARLLSGYLAVDTRNPPGNETVGARHLAALLAREGIASEIVEHAPGRGSLIARLRGSGEAAPLCMLSHIDVAEASAREWPVGKGPLSGRIEGGTVWGRGALDMKGMGAIELLTMIWVKRLKLPLRRDLILLAVADEEVENRGMRELIARHWRRIGCSHLINEGGLGLKGALFPGQTVYAISVAEKGVLWLKLIARGEGGHGSTPRPGQAPERLLRALERVMRRPPRPSVHPALTELLARVGKHRGGVAGFVLRRPALVRGLVLGKLLAKPGTRAALDDTFNVTVLDSGGNQPNVVPSTVSATIDIRLLPGHGPEAVIEELRRRVAGIPGISFETVIYQPSVESPSDDPLFRALARHAVAGRADAVAGPVLSVGFTDSLFARQQGVHAYGLVPFEVTEEEASTMHGVGERVSVANLERGLRVLLGAVLETAADLRRLKPPVARQRPPPFVPVPAPPAPADPAPASSPASAPASLPSR
jgi:acetylornithine deacetylase/succinyl-diaminopimelate desuccinylase-like protein